MIKSAKKFLQFLDILSYAAAIIQLINKNFETGSVLTIISLLLHLFLFYTSKQDKIKNALLAFLPIDETSSSFKKQFTIFCVIYALVSVLLYVLASLFDSTAPVYLNIFALPIIFSLFMLYLKAVYNNFVKEFVEIYYVICPLPHIILFIIGMFIANTWGFRLVIVLGVLIVYIPTYLLSTLVEKICSGND